MIPFTDEDLKRLKEDLPNHELCCLGGIDALLARLEAAEKVCLGIEMGGFGLGGAVIEWRKAAGK